MFKAQVIILAGGQGSRLRPYTMILPKPLLPVENHPILEILIRQLKHCGFERIVISTGYLAELIEAYFGNGSKWGVKIRYVKESSPLGTAGAIKLVQHIEKDFLVLNGDLFTDMDFSDFLKQHIVSRSMATIAIREHLIKNDYGVINVGPDQQLLGYSEKPSQRSFVSMGVNAFHLSVKDRIKKNERIGMPDLMLRLRDDDKKVSCCHIKGIWLDLGKFDDLEKAQELFIKNKKKFIK